MTNESAAVRAWITSAEKGAQIHNENGNDVTSTADSKPNCY